MASNYLRCSRIFRFNCYLWNDRDYIFDQVKAEVIFLLPGLVIYVIWYKVCEEEGAYKCYFISRTLNFREREKVLLSAAVCLYSVKI